MKWKLVTALEKEERVTTFLFTFQAVSRISGTIMTALFPVHSRPESSTSQNKPWAERSPYILLLNFLFFKPLQMTNSSQPETLEKELDRVGKRKREAEREREEREKKEPLGQASALILPLVIFLSVGD